jgi:hypothetical protein
LKSITHAQLETEENERRRHKAHAEGGMALYVVKRDGREEPVAFDKITARIKKLSYGLSQEFCDPVRASDDCERR